MRNLRVLVLSDGRPGHFHLADGVVAALARRRTVEVTRLDVRRPRWLPGRVASTLTSLGPAADWSIASALGTRARPGSGARFDLVVSAGGDTLSANIAQARLNQCPNIFYGSLRRYRPTDFSLVLTSYAQNDGRPNHAHFLKPSAFDPGSLPVVSWVADPAARQTLLTLGLLIGGDSGTVRYAPSDWDDLLALLTDGTQPIRWIISNSRRTPTAVSDRLATWARAHEGQAFIDVRSPGGATLTDLFARCAAIAVTVDSSSMVSEAIWARRRVAVLLPKAAALPALEQCYREDLAHRGWTQNLALHESTLPALLAALDTVTPLTTNPLDDLADLIERRILSLFSEAGTSEQGRFNSRPS